MSIVVADCPRCRAKKMTMDVHHSVLLSIEHDWLPTVEAFCVCRNCGRSIIYVLRVSNYEFAKSSVGREPHKFNGALNNYIDDPERYICIRDMGSQKPPDHVPDDVASAFNQGATALAVECWDAAAAMFRKSVDLATTSLLPAADEPGLNAKTRRDLGLRLPWLFANNKLPLGLQELSTCVREDGNDGAHAGRLTKADAQDLLDFATALLERIYTEPARLRLAKERREQRRAEKEE